MALKFNDIAGQLGYSESSDLDDATTAQITRLLAVATQQVADRTAGLALPTNDVPDDAPEGTLSAREHLLDALTLRYVAYLYPGEVTEGEGGAGEFRNYAAAWRYSGCAGMVAPYRRPRARKAEA